MYICLFVLTCVWDAQPGLIQNCHGTAKIKVRLKLYVMHLGKDGVFSHPRRQIYQTRITVLILI